MKFATFILALSCLTFKAQAEPGITAKHVLKLQPKLDAKFAQELATKLTAKAKLFKINPKLSLAILMQESSLTNQHTYKTRVENKRYCDEGGCYSIKQEINEAFDLTIAQINIHTAKHYQLDLARLFNKDLDYALECHLRILKDKMQMCAHLGAQSFSCYHSTNEPYRMLYYQLVQKYL